MRPAARTLGPSSSPLPCSAFQARKSKSSFPSSAGKLISRPSSVRYLISAIRSRMGPIRLRSSNLWPQGSTPSSISFCSLARRAACNSDSSSATSSGSISFMGSFFGFQNYRFGNRQYIGFAGVRQWPASHLDKVIRADDGALVPELKICK